LQTEYRESLQREADEAIYARRAHAVEKERQIKQSELAAEIELAERRKELVDTEAHNKLKLAEASVKSQEMELAIYEAVPPTTVAAPGAQGASVVVAASGVASSLPSPFDRSAERLVFSVREPFPSNVTGTTLAYGAIGRDSPLVVSSRMSQGGVVFSDGIEFDFLEFNSGSDVTVGIASQKAHLVVRG
jgi:hypothetical protein